MRRLLLIRHGRPRPVAGVAPSAWPLAQGAASELRAFGHALGLRRDLPIVSSNEPKAISTVEALSDVRPVVVADFAEVDKPWLDDPEEHRTATLDYLAGVPLPGWEPLSTATTRFETGLARLGADPVIVTHGTVMTAWLAAVSGIDNPGMFWQELRLPDAFAVDLHSGRCERRP